MRLRFVDTHFYLSYTSQQQRICGELSRDPIMTIQIDDAGYGSLIGPTFIGAYRKETGEFVFGEVSLNYFRGARFNTGDYIREASRVVQGLLQELESAPSEPLEVCTGNIFDDVPTSISHPMQRIKIEGPLQTSIEGVFTNYLVSLGVPVDGLGPGAEHFRVCTRWIAADYPARERHVKTGWGKWASKWRPIIRSRAARGRSRVNGDGADQETQIGAAGEAGDLSSADASILE